MRVIGYVRDAPGPDRGEPVFAQSELIRRWVAHNRCQLVAICQDTPTGDTTGDRAGFRALLGIVSAGHIDTVLVPDLTALSADLMAQEIMLHDLRLRGVNVISTDDADLPALSEPATDPARLLIRDLLTKQHAYREIFADGYDDAGEPDADGDVLIELIPYPEEPARAS